MDLGPFYDIVDVASSFAKNKFHLQKGFMRRTPNYYRKSSGGKRVQDLPRVSLNRQVPDAVAEKVAELKAMCCLLLFDIPNLLLLV